MAIKSEDLYLSIPNASPIFSKLAISSQFKVSLDLVRKSQSGDNLGLYDHLTNCGIFNNVTSASEKYDFLCSQASLPGSNFDVAEEMGSRQGMIERFATRRIYSQFDLTFYIDDDYNVLRMLEEWMNYINPVYNQTNGRYDGSESSQLNAYQERNTYSRFRYPDDYRRKIRITKFERDFLKNPNDQNNTFKNMPLLTYHFIDTFPVNINAVPMSYDGSTFLQVTVAFTYLRHTIEKHGNVQQSVRERLTNTNQLTQVNPLRPRAVGNEIRPSSSNPVPDAPVGYVSGKPYYGPFHPHDITSRFTQSDVGIGTTGTIKIENHKRKTGDVLTYIKGETIIGGLEDKTNYYIIKVDDNTVGLSTSSSDANSGIGVSFTSVGSGVHQLYEKTVKMVGAKHLPYPHPLIYDTLAESLPGSTLIGDIVTETNPPPSSDDGDSSGGDDGGSSGGDDSGSSGGDDGGSSGGDDGGSSGGDDGGSSGGGGGYPGYAS